MATNTYVALQTQTVGSAVASVTLNMGSTISQAYTDLRLVISGTTTVTGYSFTLQLNGDAGSNYSQTLMSGNGTNSQSARYSNSNNSNMYLGGWVNGFSTTDPNVILVDLMNYSNNTTFKSVLWRSGVASRNTEAGVILWRNTNAITSITINAQAGSNIGSGTTLSLYGIAADTNAYTPKATGGTITADTGYVYHTFTSTGTFTPSQTLTCDVLVVGGGGGGSSGISGTTYHSGGAASIVSEQFGLTATASAKTVTVGAGGAGSTSPNSASSGGNSSIVLATTITATGGGGAPTNGNGGSNASYSGGTGSNLTGGGAGAGGNGGNGSSSVAGQGGIGVLSTILGYRIAGGGNGAGFGTQPASVDGGGRGGADGQGYTGAAPTTYGAGAGGAFDASFRNGYQGVVVIRYAK